MQPILFGTIGQFHGIRNKGIPSLLFGRMPAPTAKLQISGVTKDSTGAILAACTVTLFRTVDNVAFETVVSDGSGAYSFSAIGLSETYYVVAYKTGSPDVAGITVNTLEGV